MPLKFLRRPCTCTRKPCSTKVPRKLATLGGLAAPKIQSRSTKNWTFGARMGPNGLFCLARRRSEVERRLLIGSRGVWIRGEIRMLGSSFSLMASLAAYRRRE